MPVTRPASFAFVSALCLVLFRPCPAPEPYAAQAAETDLFALHVKPGRLYELELPQPDGVPVGTRWQGGVFPLVSAEQKAASQHPSPLAPMFRKQFIIKADDLATWSLADFQRFARLIITHDAKADLGIVPGKCSEEVFAWVRTLDLGRFEIWNHTWTHGADGVPNHYHQPYDVQGRNLDLAHNTVREKTGITMHAFCGGGIRYRGQGVHDQDEATHWVVRNHPDYKVHYHADAKFADRGYGQINSEGIFMPWRFSWFENEWLNEDRDPAFVQRLKKRWPQLDWNRPSALGNAAELKWRFDHPFWNVPESGQIDNMVAQFHPALWKDAELKALSELLEYVKQHKDWRFANGYETYKWLRDRGDFLLVKTSSNRYLLDAKSLRFEHRLLLRLPRETKVREQVYCQGRGP